MEVFRVEQTDQTSWAMPTRIKHIGIFEDLESVRTSLPSWAKPLPDALRGNPDVVEAYGADGIIFYVHKELVRSDHRARQTVNN